MRVAAGRTSRKLLHSPVESQSGQVMAASEGSVGLTVYFNVRTVGPVGRLAEARERGIGMSISFLSHGTARKGKTEGQASLCGRSTKCTSNSCLNKVEFCSRCPPKNTVFFSRITASVRQSCRERNPLPPRSSNWQMRADGKVTEFYLLTLEGGHFTSSLSKEPSPSLSPGSEGYQPPQFPFKLLIKYPEIKATLRVYLF